MTAVIISVTIRHWWIVSMFDTPDNDNKRLDPYLDLPSLLADKSNRQEPF